MYIFRCSHWQYSYKMQRLFPSATPLIVKTSSPAALIYSLQLPWNSLSEPRDVISVYSNIQSMKRHQTHNSNWQQLAMSTESPRTEQKKTELSPPLPRREMSDLRRANKSSSVVRVGCGMEIEEKHISWLAILDGHSPLNQSLPPLGRQGNLSTNSSICRNSSAESLFSKFKHCSFRVSWALHTQYVPLACSAQCLGLQLTFYVPAF